MNINKKTPLVTFALFAYNQEQFISEAVEGAFSQTYSPLEIILSDDCSSDRTFEIMEEMVAAYKGPHKIILNGNEKNLGIAGHINKVIEIAKGDLIVMAAGDDISLPERTLILTRQWIGSGKSSMSIYSGAIVIDENSIANGSVLKKYVSDRIKIIEDEQIVLGCAHAFDKRVFEIFGPLNSDVIKEDQVIPFRACLLGNVVSIPDELVKYRDCQSDWRKPPDSINNPTKLLTARYKGGILRISAFEQMKKDLETLDKSRHNGLPIYRMKKCLDDKILQNRLFVNLIDRGLMYIFCHLRKEKHFGISELKALKRYVKLLIINKNVAASINL